MAYVTWVQIMNHYSWIIHGSKLRLAIANPTWVTQARPSENTKSKAWDQDVVSD